MFGIANNEYYKFNGARWSNTGSSRTVSVGARGKFLRFESHTSFTYNLLVNVVLLASFALASMTGNSVFVISPGGYVFERFWNQANWVYVRHNGFTSSPIVQVSTIKQGGTLFASTAEGILCQRIARGFSSPLYWKALPS